MSKEAMKLALEALENSRSLEPVDVQWVKGKRHAAITALREALAEQPAQQEFVSPGGGYVPAIPAQQRPIKTFHDGKAWPVQEPAQQDSTCNNALRIQGKAYPRTCKKCGLGPCVELAQQALDKKADNARELGLDYEPAQDSGIVTAGGFDPRTQRTWVGLTDEEILDVNMSTVTKLIDEPIVCDTDHNIIQLGKAIEAKLRSKNEDRN